MLLGISVTKQGRILHTICDTGRQTGRQADRLRDKHISKTKDKMFGENRWFCEQLLLWWGEKKNKTSYKEVKPTNICQQRCNSSSVNLIIQIHFIHFLFIYLKEFIYIYKYIYIHSPASLLGTPIQLLVNT